MLSTIKLAILIGFSGLCAVSPGASSAPPEGRGCALAMAVDEYNRRDYLPKFHVDPAETERAFIRMQERAPTPAIALLWVKNWGRAKALRAAVANNFASVATKLTELGLKEETEQLVFLLSRSEFDLAHFLMTPAQSRAGTTAARALLNVKLEPSSFFPSTDKSGLASQDQYPVYFRMLSELAQRLGLDVSDIARPFETWVRARPTSLPLAKALVDYLRSRGIEI